MEQGWTQRIVETSPGSKVVERILHLHKLKPGEDGFDKKVNAEYIRIHLQSDGYYHTDDNGKEWYIQDDHISDKDHPPHGAIELRLISNYPPKI